MRIERNSPIVTYGVAVFSVATALAIRLSAWSVFSTEIPFLFFVTAVAVAAWFGGFGPGVVATVLSAVAVSYFMLPLFDDRGTAQAVHIIGQIVFVPTGALISLLMRQLRDARALSEEAGRKARQRAAEAEEGKRILDALMEHIPEGVIIADVPDAKVRMISSHWCELLGLPRDAVVGISLESLLERRHEVRHSASDKSGGMADHPLMKALRGGELVAGQEWSLRRADGATLPVLCSAGPIRDWAGNAIQGVVCWQDITERRRVEEELKRAHADLDIRVRERTAELAKTNLELEAERRRLLLFLDNLPFFVCLLAPDHSVRFANRCFRTLFPEAQARPSFGTPRGGVEPCGGCPACRAREAKKQVEWEWRSPTGRIYQVYDHPFATDGSDSLVLEFGLDLTERRTVEQAVELERNKLLNILNSMREAVYIVNPRHQIEFTNPAFDREFGPPEQALTCYQHLHGRTDPCPWCKNPEVFAGKSIAWEWTSPRNGKEYDVFDTPIVNQDGSVSKLKILHDVTEHKRVQEKLRHSESLMRKMLDTLPVGVAICDKDGTLMEANPHVQEIWGGARLVGVEQYGEYRGWWLKSGEPIPAEEWALARAVRKGETSINEEIDIEAFDGTRKIILNSAAPVRSDTGEIVAAIVVNQDITHIKRAEEERARQHRQLESLWRVSRRVDTGVDTVYGNILSELLLMTQSRYAFFGFPNEDESIVTIHSWSEDAMKDCRVPSRTREFPVGEAGLWAEAVRTRQAVIVNEDIALHPASKGVPDGHVPLTRLMVVPVLSLGRTVMVGAVANKTKEYTEEDANQVHAFLTAVQAVIDKAKAEEALRESQRQLQHLSSKLLTAQETERLRISRELHDELGQVLTLVKLRIGLIEMNLPETHRQLREHCTSASSYVAQALENMRRLSRDLCPAALESLGVTAAIRRLISESITASNIHITTEIDDIDHLFSPESSILLYRVFQETLTNIMRHSEAKEVTIFAKEREGRVEFQVQDDGKGMALEDAGLWDGAAGRSMGLAIMRERVRTLGGSLEISSQKRMGTSLRFSVPIAERRGSE